MKRKPGQFTALWKVWFIFWLFRTPGEKDNERKDRRVRWEKQKRLFLISSAVLCLFPKVGICSTLQPATPSGRAISANAALN